MKTIRLSLLFLLLPIVALTQKYHPLIEINKSWDIGYYLGGDPCFNSAERLLFTGDTSVINGIIYQKMTVYPIAGTQGTKCIYPPFHIINSPTYYTSRLIREDTATKKAYIYFSNTNKEWLLYDFSLNVGDTLSAYGVGPIVLQSIVPVILRNGESRKKFCFKFSSDCDSYYIEGIGGPNGLLETIIPPAGESTTFCVKEDNEALLNGGWPYSIGDPCGTSLAINENDHAVENVIVNNSKTQISILIHEDYLPASFKLIDCQGKILISREIGNEQNVIPIEFLPPGLYCYILMNSYFVKTGKIFKI
jgi:hypothetical protein